VIQPKRFLTNALGFNPSQDSLYRIGPPVKAETDGEDAVFEVPLIVQVAGGAHTLSDGETLPERFQIRVRLYGDAVIRMMISPPGGQLLDESPMLEWDPSLTPVPCELEATDESWTVTDGSVTRWTMPRGDFSPELSPDGQVTIEFQSRDQFIPAQKDALAGCRFVPSDGVTMTGIAVAIQPGERFCGTGERFDRMDLFGRQIDLINEEGAGANSGRTYKNIPFLMSSRPYGLFVHSSAKQRIDLGARSHRSLQWFVADDALDVFFIGGGGFSEILRNYRRITGFPGRPPVWSFGSWMSRMTYLADSEVSEVAERLRREQYPMDVLCLDTGWFGEDWNCDWRFSEERFPDPPGLFRRMKEQGFRVSLWQCPFVNRGTSLRQEADERGYTGRTTSDAGVFWLGDTLDFTNPAAVEWYQSSLLRPLLEMGAAAIKTDFGEEIDETAEYHAMTANRYHNLLPLLYQRAAWEIIREVTGEGMIWARSSWAGSQRYPTHWSGDAASSFDGLAGSLCGGLHLGLSGFAFWSHDVGGFHGIPDFMKSAPTDELYTRWTQHGVFSSHIRFHGTNPREPWHFPEVSSIVRQWLRLRYALLPYIIKQADTCCRSGDPMLRPLVLEWTEDPAAWSISDEYMFGDAFLVCPVLAEGGIRNVYLPDAKWVDFWTGEVMDGPLHLRSVSSPLSRMPLYLRHSSVVEFAEPVQHTGELRNARTFRIAFDDDYAGFQRSELARLIRI
jgi:alpha-D-xyloside xylohydrolase